MNENFPGVERLRKKIYLGDSVYCGNDGYQIWVFTSNGIEVQDAIALDDSVVAHLKTYVEEWREDQDNERSLEDE